MVFHSFTYAVHNDNNKWKIDKLDYKKQFFGLRNEIQKIASYNPIWSIWFDHCLRELFCNMRNVFNVKTVLYRPYVSWIITNFKFWNCVLLNHQLVYQRSPFNIHDNNTKNDNIMHYNNNIWLMIYEKKVKSSFLR